MLEKFLVYIADNRLLTDKHKVLLAVSGGIDSIVMMHLFHEAKFKPNIAHCNFNLRATESDDDELFVLEMAKKLNMRHHTASFETTDYAGKNNLSVQMAARELRYNWFNELAKKFNYDCIAIAHNRDDLVETLLINLSRGTGIKGLTGIKPKQNKIIRPLLFASRSKIEEYAKLRKIKYREDSSNDNIKYQRNLIRHKIIPLFEKLNPSFKETIVRESEILYSTYKVYKQDLEKINKEITIQYTPDHVLSIGKILSLKLTPEILYDLLDEYGFSYSTVQNIFNSLKEESGKLFYSRNYVLLKDRKTLVIEALQKTIHDESFELKRDITNIDFPIHLRFSENTKDENFKLSTGKKSIALDFDLLSYPLKLRRWQKGDYFYPLGMKNKKKLSDFFMDRKINRLDKEKLWLLTSETDIVWIVGHQIDDRYKVTSKTMHLLLITING